MEGYSIGARLLFAAHRVTGVGVQQLYSARVVRATLRLIDACADRAGLLRRIWMLWRS
jgi:hypothetical protein